MHYNPNPRLTSESYVHPSVIITIISSGVFVYHSNGTGTRYFRNHNVWGMCGILAHPAVPALLFLMYHRSLHIHKFRNHNVWHSSTPSRPVIIICNVSLTVGCISIYLEIVTHYLRNLPRQVV
jgi:hypothetical protein